MHVCVIVHITWRDIIDYEYSHADENKHRDTHNAMTATIQNFSQRAVSTIRNYAMNSVLDLVLS